MENVLQSQLVHMNQQSNYTQYSVVAASLLIAGAFIYWYGTSVYQISYEFLPTNQSTTTVTISADKLAELETQARQYRTIASMVEQAGTSSFLSKQPDQPAISANVTARPPQSPYDTFVLNVGETDGVTVGAGVWWPAGVYLGQVVEVDRHTSVVELVTAPGVKHAATLAGIPVTTTGIGGDGLYVEIPDTESVPVGTAVISDLYELPIGVVAATEQLPTTNLRAVFITRFVSSAVIEHVYVQEQ